MSPRPLDLDTVEARLRLMREAVEDLAGLGPVDAATLTAYITAVARFVLAAGRD